MQLNPNDTADTHLVRDNVPGACAFLRDPFPDCYCLNISGAKIPRMLEYCTGNFTLCRIFRRWAQRDKTPEELAQLR